MTNRAELDPNAILYEVDDNPTSGGVPSKPVSIMIDSPLNRYLESGDIDWFVLTLP